MKQINPKCKLGGELNRNFTLGLLVFTLFACSIFYITSDTKMEEGTDETAMSSSGIAIFVEDSSGDYQLLSSKKFPQTALYTLNTTESNCVNGGTISQNSSTYKVNVSVEGSDACSLYFDFHSSLLSDYIISLADTETTPSFTKSTTDEGVLTATDDYGTSYYYRGAVENNYVYFAGFYWRIIRVNGDGSIRLIYDGTTAHDNGSTSTNKRISATQFNTSSSYNAYVGYMYGTPGSSTYSAEHANTNDSNVKKVLDTWYENNLLGTQYETYLADTIFCNDRSFYDGDATGTTKTYYNGKARLTGTPQLTCNQQHDAFTVDDTTYGNGDLTYPIGLITADEVRFAGGNTGPELDSSNYLYGGSAIMTMTPYDFSGWANIIGAGMLTLMNSVYSSLVAASLTVKPVINLSSSVRIASGDGSMDNPFVIEMRLSDAVIAQANTTKTPNFWDSATTDEGVFAMEDDYGTSYYFRGAVENNYVYFAGYYWRIVRVNGNGTVRLIYDGTSAYANGVETSDRLIGYSAYNSNYYTNSAYGYVGYMYGTIGADSYEEEYENTNPSTIQEFIDAWYENNLKGTAYESYLADSIFCNDRSIDFSDGDGYGDGWYYTEYSGYTRINDNNPQLTCNQKNDAFTVDDTTNGNGDLTYPIGLITADEIMAAGTPNAYYDTNLSFYLYTGEDYWTMTPTLIDMTDEQVYIATLGELGLNFEYYANIDVENGVKPVINLKSDVLISSGNGTLNSPYTLKY